MPISFQTRQPRPKLRIMGVKPVHPRAARSHGLLGAPFVRQHMYVDDKWTPLSLGDQFKGMTDLLVKYRVLMKLEEKAKRKHNIDESHELRQQCRDGREKLSNILRKDDSVKIRNILNEHKDMQRLYWQMPIIMVLDNMKQRTFVLQKEYDRLEARLKKLKSAYRAKLLERSNLENRIKYENEFVLEEEIKARTFYKKIENSELRLQGCKTINTTYHKMIAVLKHDSIFYEPILSSLSQDVADQSKFIKHILSLGIPVIEKYEVLSKEYLALDERTHKSLGLKLQQLNKYGVKNGSPRKSFEHKAADSKTNTSSQEGRYERETFSMQRLQGTLATIEDTIKEIKVTTLCLHAKEVYPRIKTQHENNILLEKESKRLEEGHEIVQMKKKRAEVRTEAVLDKYTKWEMGQLAYIKQLKKAIAAEDELERELLDYIRNRAEAHITLRLAVWHLSNILRHVDQHPAAVSRNMLHTSYLKMPLLKFDMFNMHAYAPPDYEENVEIIMTTIKRKIDLLMNAIPAEKPQNLKFYTEEYHEEYVDSTVNVESEHEDVRTSMLAEETLPEVSKNLRFVPNRDMIKAQSAKIVEDFLKRDE